MPGYKLYPVDYNDQELCKMFFILCEELRSWPETLQSLSWCQIGSFSICEFYLRPIYWTVFTKDIPVVHFSDLSWTKAGVEETLKLDKAGFFPKCLFFPILLAWLGPK